MMHLILEQYNISVGWLEISLGVANSVMERFPFQMFGWYAYIESLSNQPLPLALNNHLLLEAGEENTGSTGKHIGGSNNTKEWQDEERDPLVEFEIHNSNFRNTRLK